MTITAHGVLGGGVVAGRTCYATAKETPGGRILLIGRRDASSLVYHTQTVVSDVTPVGLGGDGFASLDETHCRVVR
jgi:hypothetical protein